MALISNKIRVNASGAGSQLHGSSIARSDSMNTTWARPLPQFGQRLSAMCGLLGLAGWGGACLDFLFCEEFRQLCLERKDDISRAALADVRITGMVDNELLRDARHAAEVAKEDLLRLAIDGGFSLHLRGLLCGLGGLGAAGLLLAQSKQHLSESETRLSGLTGGKVADRCLRAACGFGDLRLGQSLTRLDFGDNVVPLHARENNGFTLFVQRFSNISFP